jgi:hypothetical protein
MTADNAKFGQFALGAVNTAAQMPKTAGSTGGIVLKAKSTNATPVYIGQDNTVTDLTGFELLPGEGITIEVLNLGRMWMYGATSADRFCWASVNA